MRLVGSIIEGKNDGVLRRESRKRGKWEKVGSEDK